MFITTAIEAHKRRNVVTLDIPGAYLYTDKNEEVVVLLRGRLAELMVQVDPKLNQKYACYNKHKRSENITRKNTESITWDTPKCIAVLFKAGQGVLNLTHMTHVLQKKRSMVTK